MAIECKWKLNAAETVNFQSFKNLYPDARLVIVATDGAKPRLNRKIDTIEAGLDHLPAAVELAMAGPAGNAQC